MSGLVPAALARLRLLGVEPAGVAALALDAFVVAVVAAWLARRARVGRAGSARELLAASLLGLACVVLPATALGAAGALSNRALVASHLALLALVVAAARGGGWRATLAATLSPLGGQLRALAALPAGLFRRDAWRRRRRAESALVAGILLVLALDLVLALGTLPLNYDAQTYRLSRVALWLQEGSIAHFATDDERLNYVGQNADLVVLWLVSFFPRDYPLVHLPQYLAAWLACGAVYELGALLGWRRRWRLAAAATLLGIPSVGIQAFTAQSDLFTAATLGAGTVFALAALRRGRTIDWALAGVGAGLALGAKGTVFYFGPGLLVLFAVWGRLARCPWRAALRGAALAVVPVVVLSGFNFWQNFRTYGHPLASPGAIEGVHGPGRQPGSKTWLNWKRLAWQLLEPGSNPFVPEALRAPLYERLSANLTAVSGGSLRWRRTLERLEGRPDEDHASFGLVATLAIFAGGLAALARSHGERRGEALAAAAMCGAVVAFFVFFCSLSTMNEHQFRYFALVAPLGAVVAVAGFAGARWRAAWAAAAGLAALQLATALVVGTRSEYHGWAALVDPARSTHFPHWRDGRALVAALPAGARRLAVALPFDSWLAPYLRTGEPREVRLVPHVEIDRAPTLGNFLSRSRVDALVIDPSRWRGRRFDGVAVLAAPWILRTPRIAVVPLAPGQRPRPAIVFAEGIQYGGWSAPRARFELAGWAAPSFELELLNAAPLARRVEVASADERRTYEVAPGATLDVEIAVAERDRVTLAVSPRFVPARDAPPSPDRRELGLLVVPSRIAAESGVYGDRWTAPRAALRVDNWISGSLALELANPSPLARTVRAASGVARAELVLPPGATGRLALDVLPRDLVTLEVEPPFVPAALAGAADKRELGVLLAPDLLRPAAPGEYR